MDMHGLNGQCRHGSWMAVLIWVPNNTPEDMRDPSSWGATSKTAESVNPMQKRVHTAANLSSKANLDTVTYRKRFE